MEQIEINHWSAVHKCSYNGINPKFHASWSSQIEAMAFWLLGKFKIILSTIWMFLNCNNFDFSRIIRGALKLRYLLLGGAITGGVTLNKRYEEWRDGLPDFKWLDDVLPDTEQWNKFSSNLKTITNSVRDSIEIGKFTQ